ncbi:MAG: F0F1 ATP synthase subunit gamma, partial [Vicinamibacteria bacterium]|nr:F0F1 ATP synthase subunit gamma [Vicinamibacteria bacterium]
GTFNRLRQAGIDEELFDVISGWEAAGGSVSDGPVHRRPAGLRP